MIKTRIRVAPDGTLSARAIGIQAGEHNGEITIRDAADPAAQLDSDDLRALVRAIQAEVARLRQRNPDEIIGYNERGHFG